jgi:aerobic-type carbon monoxide dehydrogenase small subunit (CoxS/CutS family)
MSSKSARQSDSALGKRIPARSGRFMAVGEDAPGTDIAIDPPSAIVCLELPMERTISFRLNGKPTSVKADGERMLLWVLRSDLGLTGTKFGCGEGLCGACTVIVGRDAVRSCVTPIQAVEGQQVLTIEGIGQNGLHAVQKAFLEHHAFQCGYCTSGMIVSAYALLLKTPHPTREEIARHLEDNLCRCGAHGRILDAVQEAAAAAGAVKGGVA